MHSLKGIYNYLEGHMILGDVAQNNKAFLLDLTRTKAQLLSRTEGEKT